MLYQQKLGGIKPLWCWLEYSLRLQMFASTIFLQQEGKTLNGSTHNYSI